MKQILQLLEHNIFIAEKTLDWMDKEKVSEDAVPYIVGRKAAMEEIKDFIDRLPKGAV